MALRLGVVFPQNETSDGVLAVDEYLGAVQALSYDHLLAADHVVGVDRSIRPDWQGPYCSDDLFHEPLTLFAYLAAKTSLDLMSSILILPQRQTVLVAKQAAQVDLFCGGKLRLGVGIGWNAVEYEALSKEFSTRGLRFDEQIDLLRRLWTEPAVHFEGSHEVVLDAGILPLPVQRPIPIWIAAGLDPRALQRVGRLADGFIPRWLPDRRQRGVGDGALSVDMSVASDALGVIRASAETAGRDPEAIGIQGRLPIAGRDDDWILELATGFSEIGATWLAVDTMGAGLRWPDGHLAALRRMAELLEGHLD